MKKTLALAVSLVAVTGCGLLTNPVWENQQQSATHAKGYSVINATEERRWEYDEDAPIYEISSEVLSVTITNVPVDKTLYLVQHNTGDTVIPVENQRTVQVAAGSRAVIADCGGTLRGVADCAAPVSGRRHFVGATLPLPAQLPTVRSALTAPQRAVTPITPREGMTTKRIYIDTNNAMTAYTAKNATLRANGEFCYVWVIDDYYASEKGGCKVDVETAQRCAEAFDKMYKVITNVFGDESDLLIDSMRGSLADIADYSDTGEKINIVIYDIAADYNSRSENQTGVVGYFYAKDYYYNVANLPSSDIRRKSNVGKYLYIDSGFAVSDFDNIVSTLAHEFQHMVNFNRKNIEQNLLPSTAYNEMLSMLCEDMMQDFLELEDYASPKSRIQSFNAYYSQSGITEYRDDDYAVLSYSTSYAFGAWLCRQYGGAALVREMMNNNSTDTASILAAVNMVAGTSLSFGELFQQFLCALTAGDSSTALYTHNQDAPPYLNDYTSYRYPMRAFNLWDKTRTWYDSDGDGKKDAVYTFSTEDERYALRTYAYTGYDWSGPFLFSTSYGTAELRADNGISLHGVAETRSLVGTDGDTVRVTFSTSGASTLTLYVIIQ